MSSSKHWALYATNRHLGTHREHRLSGARLGPAMVRLGWTPMHGWQAQINLARLGVEVTWAPRKDDPRVKSWLDALFGHLDVNSGLADANDGRWYEGVDDEFYGPHRPAASWRADDPQQPIGWHHDGMGWVQNDDGGWWRDRTGYWRYNAPGEVGWQEQADGSWRYSKAKRVA